VRHGRGRSLREAGGGGEHGQAAEEHGDEEGIAVGGPVARGVEKGREALSLGPTTDRHS
jgi:hypothetical protein